MWGSRTSSVRRWIALGALLGLTVASVATGLGGVPPAGATPAPYADQQVTVTSFDGTPLNVYFFPATGLDVGQTAPTVLDGSAWPLPAYPQSQTTIGQVGPVGTWSFGANLLGPASLNAAGYNVITWDNRGFGSSGGQVNVDNPSIEGRDVTAIINWLATQPAAELRAPNYPVVGMTGISYGGGIQLSAAADDHRLAVIEPNMAWDSLDESLIPNGVIKAGWGNLLCETGTLLGARYPAELTKICASAQSGVVTPDEIAFADAASPGPVIGQITTPTLLLGGTADTLFPLTQDLEVYRSLVAAGTPVKMMWYCGGHGICQTNSGPTDYVVNEEMNFLAKYLKGAAVSTGPGFEYLDQNGTWHSAPSYPLPTIGHLSASGGGWLSLNTSDSSGIAGVAAAPATNAITIPVAAPLWSVDSVGSPTLSVTYQGLGSTTASYVAAQLVDTSTGTVLGGQATAIPLVLDGHAHTVTLPLNAISWNLTPSSRIELQLTDDSDLFEAQPANGLLFVGHAGLTVPLQAS